MRNQAFFSPHRLFLFSFLFFVSVALAWTQIDRHTHRDFKTSDLLSTAPSRTMFLFPSHCGSRCSVFIFTDRIHCSRAGLSGGLPGWWSSRSNLETHCLSLPHWEIFVLGFYLLIFWGFYFCSWYYTCAQVLNLNISQVDHVCSDCG